jgi:hypothetical protein
MLTLPQQTHKTREPVPQKVQKRIHNSREREPGGKVVSNELQKGTRYPKLESQPDK